ncbi:MAG: DUF58 domain-containing protein [Proteobacteria bacterium]|nr:DUF58 domain-containing protein [Pseudomonadota bacterium]
MIGRWLTQRKLRSFKGVSRVSLWFEARLTNLGRIIFSTAFAAAVFGIDPNQTFALQLAAGLFSILTVALLLSIRWRPNITVSRIVPDTVTVEHPTSYSVSIRNYGSKPEADLVLADFLKTKYPVAVDFMRASRSHRDRNVNWFDRVVGFPRWLALVRRSRGARLEALNLPAIPPHTTINVTLPLRALRRGKLVFTHLELRRPDPLGIFLATHRIACYGEVVSLPKRYPTPRLDWHSHRHFHRGGLTQITTVGDSEEFVGLREYRPGDPLRHIHWRSFAKRGSPVVKEHQDEYFDRHALLIDTFLGDSSDTDFETAVSIAASFILCERPTDSILDLVFIDRKVWRLTTGRGLSNNRQVLLQLAELNPSTTDNFDQLADYLRRYLERLASVIIVATTWDGARQTFVNELQQKNLRCLVLRACEAPHIPSDTHANAQGGHPNTVRPSCVAQDIARITIAAGRAVR